MCTFIVNIISKKYRKIPLKCRKIQKNIINIIRFGRLRLKIRWPSSDCVCFHLLNLDYMAWALVRIKATLVVVVWDLLRRFRKWGQYFEESHAWREALDCITKIYDNTNLIKARYEVQWTESRKQTPPCSTQRQLTSHVSKRPWHTRCVPSWTHATDPSCIQ